MSAYLTSALQQFRTYKSLGENAIAQIPDDALFFQYNEESNSIATIVKHMHGNMLSRWTDFLNTDGEKEWRERDAEFENDLNMREEVMKRWNEGWACVFSAIEPLKEEDLERTIYIRKEAHSVLEAINRQLTHYAYHAGQIVFLSKMTATTDWRTLSIARGKSKDFNDAMKK